MPLNACWEVDQEVASLGSSRNPSCKERNLERYETNQGKISKVINNLINQKNQASEVLSSTITKTDPSRRLPVFVLISKATAQLSGLARDLLILIKFDV